MNGHIQPDALSAMLDGEVGPDERRDIHAHLQVCTECRAMMGEYGSVREMVAGLPRLAAPHDFVAAALAPPRGAIASVRRAVRGPRRYVLAGALGAAAAVTLGGLAAPAGQSELPVEVLVARHASVSAQNNVAGQVIFAVTGR